jgi:hypothetical protein
MSGNHYGGSLFPPVMAISSKTFEWQNIGGRWHPTGHEVDDLIISIISIISIRSRLKLERWLMTYCTRFMQYIGTR